MNEDNKRYHSDTKMTPYIACSIAEGFADEEPTVDEQHDAWQYLVDTGLCWTLQGWYGRQAEDLIERGLIKAKDNK